MQQYLFRGKRKDNNLWVYGSLMTWPDGDCEIVEFNGTTEALKHTVIPETVGMWTRLTDVNGVKIFEGDMLRDPAKNEWDEKNFAAYEVFFHDGDMADNHIGWQMNRLHYFGAICGGSIIMTFLPKWASRLKIIGNVHNTPELLTPAK